MKGITVSQFYERLNELLQLKLVAGGAGLKRRILVSEINRPGLPLAGFIKYFANRRGQVLGKVEISYLRSLGPKERRKKIRILFQQKIPFCIVARNYVPPSEMVEEADKFRIPIFRSPLITIQMINKCTIFLEEMFAPHTTLIANLVEVFGIGVLIMGRSGVGKSECALGLVERGHRLISDDLVHVRLVEGEYLLGTGSEITRFHMEIRGLGIIDVQRLFGAGCVRQRKRIDLAVTLERWEQDKEYERLGLDEAQYSVMNVTIPHIIIPVRPGRDLALLIEAAALNHRIKLMGPHPVRELDRQVQKEMGKRGNKTSLSLENQQ